MDKEKYLRKSFLFKPWVIIMGLIVIAAVTVTLIFLYKNNGLSSITIKAVSTDSGETIISYQDEKGLRVQKIDPSGRYLWGDACIVALPRIYELDYAIYSDGLGGVIIFWCGPVLSGQYSSWAKVLVPSSISMQRLNANGELLWGQGIPFGTTRPGSAHAVPDGAGGVIIAWDEYIPSRQPDEPILRVNKINQEGNLLWGDKGISIAASPSREFPLYTGGFDIISDSEQGAYVFWEIQTSSNGYVTYSQHLNSDGNITWVENNIVAENKLRSAESDSAGGALVQTTELTGAFINPSVLTHIDITEKILAEYIFPTGGELLRDGSGGYFEVVESYSAPSDVSMSEADVKLDVQHLDSGGNVMWSKTALVDPGKGNRINANYFIDGENGIYIIWQKTDKYNSDPGRIFTIHLSGKDDLNQGKTNLPIFDVNGIRMVAAFSDNEGGAIIIAHTLAGLFKDNMIYAQRISFEGIKLWEQRIIIDN